MPKFAIVNHWNEGDNLEGISEVVLARSVQECETKLCNKHMAITTLHSAD